MTVPETGLVLNARLAKRLGVDLAIGAQFDHVLVVVGSVKLSENPDKSPSDASQVDAVVAEQAGPWVIDLAQEGSVPGAGGEGTATPLFVFETRDDGEPFATDQRYAFSYTLAEATACGLPLQTSRWASSG